MGDTITNEANKLFDEYKNLMTDDLKKIKSKFNILLKKAYDERTTSLFPSTELIHKNIFVDDKVLEDGLDDQNNFHESYDKLQKFVIYTYVNNLPEFDENKELIYKSREKMDEILKTFVVISEDDYNNELNKKKNLIKKFEDDKDEKKQPYWDGIKKNQKRSKKSRSPGRKKSKKRSPCRKRKSPAKYLK
jgi:hypothetical protein